MTGFRHPTLIGMTAALVVFLALGALVPDWLAFLLMVSLAKGLVVLGVMMQMRAGLVSFGQGLYYCLGAYATGMAGHFLGVSDVFIVLALGTVVCAATAAILGILMSRYREIFFAMLSLALSMILYGLLLKTTALGSSDGFSVPKPTFFGYAPADESQQYLTYAVTCVLVFAVCLVVHRYLRSTAGYLGDAIRENELRVEYLGASVRRAVHLKYVAAAAISGAGGVMTAFAVGHVDPDMAYWTTSGEFVFVALLSGTGHIAAPFLGSILLELVRTYAFEFSPYTWQMILGGTMLAIIIFLPGGLWSLFKGRAARE